MVKNCPNKSHPDWKQLVNKFGEDATWALYIKSGERIPTLKEAYKILNSPQETEGKIKEVQEAAKKINEQIIEALSNMGVSVGALSALEEAQGIKGVFDPNSSIKNGKGLVELIRIAQGHRGSEALPEEFAHLVHASLKETPLMQRLESLLSDELIQRVIEEDGRNYNKYMHTYQSEFPDTWQTKLKNEAVAKLIAKHIIKGEPIVVSPWQKLMQRIKQLFTQVFSKGDANALQESMYIADKEFGGFAAQLMEGQIKIQLTPSTYRGGQAYSLESTGGIARTILRKINETEHKRLKIAEATKADKEALKLIQERKTILNRSEYQYDVGEYEEGITAFLTQAIEDLINLSDTIKELSIHDNTPTSDLNTTARTLRDIKSYINAYKPILTDIISFYSDATEGTQLGNAKELNYLISKLEGEYKALAYPIFRNFLNQFWSAPETISVKFGRKGLRDYTIDQILQEADSDIGFMDRWLYSMAESTDLLLRLIDQPVKKARLIARDKSIETLKRLQKAQLDLEKAGYNTEFIYEKDSDGKYTGYYIREVDYNAYNEARQAKINELDEIYGGRESSYEWRREYYSWLDAHTDKVAGSNDKVPKISLYKNEAFNSLSKEQKEFYNTVIGIKNDLDKLLPDHKIDRFLLPQIRKNWVERLKASKSSSEAAKLFKEGVKDDFVYRESDDEFGARRAVRDFDNTEVHLLPLYYTQKLDDLDQLSTDVISNMALYADMAYNYSAMNDIIDLMELGKDILSNRRITDTRGGKPLIERIKSEGRDIKTNIVKPTEASKFKARLEDFYESQIYGKYMKDEGTIPGSPISIAKLANQVNKYTSLNTFALNPMAGFANVSMGDLMLRIEAIAGEYLGVKDVAWADATYAKQLPQTIAAIGKRLKDDKLSLFIEKFNLLQDHEQKVREIEMNKKSKLLRLSESSSLYFLNNCGEHWMQSRTGLALAHKYMLKDSRGKEINLWNAMEVTHRDGIPRLEFKPGITKLDGTGFAEQDLFKFQNKSRGINQRLHGIYNKEDMNAFQRTAIGRMALMFRKWMVPSLNRRFQRSMYSFDLDTYTEGYYNTTFQFMKTLIKDLGSFKLNWASQFKKLNNTQKANIWRSIIEVGHLVALMITFAVLKDAWDDDDEWGKNFMLYQTRRLQTEIGALTPGPQMIGEFFTIVKSPAAGVNYVQNLLNVLDLTEWWGEPMQSGRYKGHSRGYRNFMKVVPFNNTLYRFTHPEEASKFFLMGK